MEQIIFTGRYGDTHNWVLSHGEDYIVVEIDEPKSVPAGLHVFGPGHHPRQLPSGEFEGLDDWTSWMPMRAMNAEDAARNFYAALCQHNLQLDFPDRDDFLTRPFTDAAGQFPSDGGNQGNGYDAYPPDNAALYGVTRRDLFGEAGDIGILPSNISLRSS